MPDFLRASLIVKKWNFLSLRGGTENMYLVCISQVEWISRPSCQFPVAEGKEEDDERVKRNFNGGRGSLIPRITQITGSLCGGSCDSIISLAASTSQSSRRPSKFYRRKNWPPAHADDKRTYHQTVCSLRVLSSVLQFAGAGAVPVDFFKYNCVFSYRSRQCEKNWDILIVRIEWPFIPLSFT